jgi:hypothetical protein
MPIEDLETLKHQLQKRGFKVDDPLLSKCAACSEKAVLRYIITGKTGGRDITLCLACGDAHSWRSAAGMQTREEEIGFDLREFLK